MIIKFLFGIFLPPSQGTHTSSSISYVRAVLLGVFISGPCFIVANTHHQVPQWTINHLHSITYTSSAERVKIHQQTTLTWMIIAGTSKVQLRLLYLCEFSTLSASQPEPERMRLTLKPKTYFLPGSQSRRWHSKLITLWPQKPLETEDSTTKFWSCSSSENKKRF